MNKDTYQEFLKSADALRIYEGDTLVFSSGKAGLAGLMDYLEELDSRPKKLTALDKIMGNAAALLAVKAGCREVYSPLGSNLAAATLDKYGIKFRFDRIMPCILQANGKDMCPMENLSLNKNPEEFYSLMKARLSKR